MESEELEILSFSIANQFFAIDVDNVIEIIKFPSIIQVDKNTESAEKRLQFKNEKIPIVDLAQKMELEYVKPDGKRESIIYSLKDNKLAFEVDTVEQYSDINLGDITLMPEYLKNNMAAGFIWGIGKRDDTLIFLLDFEAL
ncbi:chemotaxis protein CheW [Elusimicrobiota bacterium]